MDTFPYDKYCPSVGASKTSARRTLEAQFGDGYRQTADDGINVDMSSYAVSWNNVDEASKTEILAFLEPRQGGAPFRFKLPDMAAPVAVYCADLSVTYVNKYLWSVSATLKRTAALAL